jgi:DNA primase
MSDLSTYKRLPNGQYRGKCPFTDNHTGKSDGSNSFFMSPEHGTYHCFSCKDKGSMLRILIREFEMSFSEAIKLVTYEKDYVKRKETVELMVDWSTPPTKYLERGISKKTLAYFKVGSYVDDFGREVTTIPQYKDKVLEGVIYLLKSKGSRKMWSSPDFDKSTHLYNWDNAKHYKSVILVEGQCDLWRLVQWGYKNVIALQGTAITTEQFKMLTTFDEIFSALDNDEAGITASELAYRLLSPYVKYKFIPYNAPDPDIESRENFSFALKNVKSYAEFSAAMHLTEFYSKAKVKVLKSLK